MADFDYGLPGDEQDIEPVSSANDFDYGVPEYEPEAQDIAKQNLEIASDKDPSEQTDVFSIAYETGVSPELVDKDLPGFQKKRSLINIDLSGHPVTAEYFANPQNALMSSDDVDNMKAMEDAMANYKAPMPEDTDGFFKNTAELMANRLADIGTAGMEGMAQLENVITEAAGAYKPGMKEEFLQTQKQTLEDIKAMRLEAEARHTPEQVKAQFAEGDVGGTLGETGLFIAETGLQSLADWTGMAINFPGYVMARSVEIGIERAANNNEEADFGHTLEAMPFAIASSLLESCEH